MGAIFRLLPIPRKRMTLAASLFKIQSALVRDDLAQMLIKRMATIHHKGKEALADYQRSNQQRADSLVQTLRDLVSACRTEGSAIEKIGAMESLLPDQGEAVLQECEAHLAHAGDNYFPFLWRFYKSHRPTLFRLVKSLEVKSTTQETSFEHTLRFLLEKEARTGDWLTFPKSEPEEESIPALDLSWMPDTWWRLVTEQRHREDIPTRLNRRHFEVCVFTQLMSELKSGDLCLPGSDQFADYREQLISWEDYHRDVAEYVQMSASLRRQMPL